MNGEKVEMAPLNPMSDIEKAPSQARWQDHRAV